MTRFALIAALVCLVGCGPESPGSEPPAWMMGSFVDDYESAHVITDSTWTMYGSTTYRISEWMLDQQKVLMTLPSDSGQTHARVDWMEFEDQEPYTWGFCIAAWDRDTENEAAMAPPSNPREPRSGCGGFPFTRMRVMPDSTKAVSRDDASARPVRPYVAPPIT